MHFKRLASIRKFVTFTCLLTVFIFGHAQSSVLEKVTCYFAPILVCSNQSDIHWSNPAFKDPSLFTRDAEQLYISRNNTSHSFSLATGALRWQHSIDPESRYFYPVIHEKNVFLARSDGYIEKRLALTGELIWSLKLGKGWVYPPAISGDKVITGGQDRMVWALDIQSGDIVQSFELGQEIVAPLIGLSGLVIVATFDSELTALDLEENTIKWNARLDAPVFSMQSDNDTLITSGMDGSIHAIDANSGTSRWHQSLFNNAQYWNLLTEKTLYSLNNLGMLYIMNTDTGNLEAQIVLEEKFAQPPVLHGQHLALITTQGKVKHISLSGLFEEKASPASIEHSSEEIQ